MMTTITTATYDFSGTVALVTGAAGGMGRTITIALANAGAKVVASDFAEPTNGELDCTGPGEIFFIRGDVSVAADVEHVLAEGTGRFGALDYAVNAAAIEFETVPLADCNDEDYDRMMSVNSRGIFLCMKHELRSILSHGRGGSIVNIASTNSFRPRHNQPAYTASKHAVLGLTRSAAMDYVKSGIRINAICPGTIDTPMLRGAIARRGQDPDEVAARLSPMGRFGLTEEIAQAVLWLCSDASSFTTGQALGVDGGMLGT